MENDFSLHMHAKHSFARRLQVPKMAASAPVRKKMALGCQVFYYSVECSKHDIHGFIHAVQRSLATLTVTMLTSCWQVLSEVELQRIFDVCKQWANSSSACVREEKYVCEDKYDIYILKILMKVSFVPQTFSHKLCFQDQD